MGAVGGCGVRTCRSAFAHEAGEHLVPAQASGPGFSPLLNQLHHPCEERLTPFGVGWTEPLGSRCLFLEIRGHVPKDEACSPVVIS